MVEIAILLDGVILAHRFRKWRAAERFAQGTYTGRRWNLVVKDVRGNWLIECEPARFGS